jgi:hypothetical protein
MSYSAELEGLDRHYERAHAWDHTILQQTLLSIASGPATFIGTGGTLAVARFAAQLHERVAGQPARVATPLEVVGIPPTARSGAVLFSAGLKHPDALATLDHLASGRFRPSAVVTLRERSEIETLVAPDVQVVSLPSLGFKEGFLATTSVMVMLTALIRAYSGQPAPEALPRLHVDMPPPEVEHLLVLTTPDLMPVGVDLETRCHELGLAAVQVTDYRNFAHGRHVGLSRRAATSAVIGLIAPPYDRLAKATLDVLPAEVTVCRWETDTSGPLSVLELAVSSMHLAGALAEAQGVNVSRPGAAPFGRRLYHLGIRRLIPPVQDGPVERKLAALAAGALGGGIRVQYEDALANWSKSLHASTFGGLVLDYDGTICSTGKRTELPDRAIQVELLRLLDGGVRVGLASGRGKSLHQDLRMWVPEEHWSNLLLGLYNGGLVMTLADDLPDLSVPDQLMANVAERVSELFLVDALDIEARALQVTMGVRPGGFAQIGRLNELIAELMSRPPALEVKVVTSGHSVDIVPARTTKRTVVERVAAACGKLVLAIGDQGDINGNDFELLAGGPWSLTVDRCSADPSRCWYLDTKSRTGPDLLRAYLASMIVGDGEFQLEWSS